MRFKIFFLATFLLTMCEGSLLDAHPAEMIIANHAKELTYTIHLETDTASYNVDVEPGQRLCLSEIITDLAYDEVPNYVSMTVRAFYNDRTYKHSRLWIEKNTFVALFDPREADYNGLYCKSAPCYSLKHSFLTPEGKPVSENSTYPNYAVYFNEVTPLPGATFQMKRLVRALYAHLYLFTKSSSLEAFQKTSAYTDNGLTCFFQGLVENGFMRKEHLEEIKEEIYKNPALIEEMVQKLNGDQQPSSNHAHVCLNCGEVHPPLPPAMLLAILMANRNP